MNPILSISILIALLSIVAVLVMGIISMVKGGEFNEKYGNRLMQARVALQALAIFLLVLSYFLSQN